MSGEAFKLLCVHLYGRSLVAVRRISHRLESDMSWIASGKATPEDVNRMENVVDDLESIVVAMDAESLD